MFWRPLTLNPIAVPPCVLEASLVSTRSRSQKSARAHMSSRAASRTVPKRRGAGAKTTSNRVASSPAASLTTQVNAWAHRYAQSKERPGLYPFTISGVPIKPLYTPADIAGMNLAKDIAVPGEYPFTRGIHTSMYRGRMFTKIGRAHV